MRRLLACLLALLGPAAFAQNCGTVILPTGIGVASSADVTSFNPLLVNSLYNQEMAGMMFLGLIWLNGDNLQVDWSRSLASSVTSPDDGTTYDVKLRAWNWSDGVPVTSADVAYAFNLIKEYGTSYAGYGAGGMPDIVKSLNIVSPTEFTVVLKRRVNPLWYEYNGLAALTPLPEHAWSKYNADQIWQMQSSPAFFKVVDGPMYPVKLDVGLDVVMLPNPHYPGPKMNLDRLIFRFFNGDGAEVQALEARAIDAADAPLAIWSSVQHLPGINLTTLPPDGSYNEVVLNLRNPDVAFFQDARVREALQDAINQPEMIRLIDHGLGTPYYVAVPAIAKAFLAPAMQAGEFPVGYDPAKARALLAAAGYSPGPDGIMQKGGKRLEFTNLMLTGDATIDQITEYLQQSFAAIGVRMKIREIEFNQLLALINNPSPSSWQAAELGETLTAYPSGEDLFKTNSYGNAGGYSDPQMDKLVAQSTDEPGLGGLYAYEEYLSDQQPVLFLERERESILSLARLHGIDKFVDGAGQFYPDRLSCTAEPRA
jgi:peptide/nickel transport system substrate-binding protein